MNPLIMLLVGFFCVSFSRMGTAGERVELSKQQEKLLSIEGSILLSKKGDSVILKFLNPTDTAVAINVNSIKHSRFSAGFRSFRPGEIAGSAGMSAGVMFDSKSLSVLEGDIEKGGLIIVQPGKSAVFQLGLQEIASVVQKTGAGLADKKKAVDQQDIKRIRSLSFAFKYIFKFVGSEEWASFTTPELVFPNGLMPEKVAQ